MLRDQGDLDKEKQYIDLVQKELDYINRRLKSKKSIEKTLEDKKTLIEKSIASNEEVVIPSKQPPGESIYLSGERINGETKWGPLVCRDLIEQCRDKFLTNLQRDIDGTPPDEVILQISRIHALKLLADMITSSAPLDRERALEYIMPYMQKKPGADLNINPSVNSESPMITPFFE
jgi:hypothetical protein